MAKSSDRRRGRSSKPKLKKKKEVFRRAQYDAGLGDEQDTLPVVGKSPFSAYIVERLNLREANFDPDD